MIKKINSLYYLADTEKDLKNIKAEMGCECFVIKEACEYKILSTGEWIKQEKPIGFIDGDDIDLTDYAKKDELPSWNTI